MDRLPWHLQIEVYKRVDIDTRRALGVAPGKICVPMALRDALGRSMARRIYMRLIKVAPDEDADCPKWLATVVTIPIAGTSRKYHLFSR